MQRIVFAVVVAFAFVLAASPASAAPPGATPAAAPATFASRVPYPPLVHKLAASGGSPARILRPARAADLAALETGKRYKFVVDGAGKLAIAPLPADAQHNEYVHPILGGGAPVRTAGGLRVERAGGTLTAVVVDEDSKSYCPTFDSLAAAAAALERLGVPAAAVRREDKRPDCAK